MTTETAMQRSRKLHELPQDEQRILIEESAGKRRRISNPFRFERDNDGGMSGSCAVSQEDLGVRLRALEV